jgi:hypothetical protein
LTDGSDTKQEEEEIMKYQVFRTKDGLTMECENNNLVDEDSCMKMKQVNNSNFVPSMHSRYVTDESQLY